MTMTKQELERKREIIKSNIIVAPDVAHSIFHSHATLEQKERLTHFAISEAYTAGCLDTELIHKLNDPPSVGYVYTRLTTTVDSSGNPRRLYIVQEIDLSQPQNSGKRVAIFIENYNGKQELRDNYPTAIELGSFEVSPTVFKDWIKIRKTDLAYKAEQAAEATNTN